MWFLNFLPDWVFHLILLAGILTMLVGYVFRFVPTIRIYQLPIMTVGILLTVAGVWYEGGIAKDQEYRAAMEEYKLKVAKAEKEAAEANGKVEVKVVTKTQTIRDAAKTVTEYIDREVVKYNNICVIPKAAIVAHDAAAKGLKMDQLSPESIKKVEKVQEKHNG